MLGIQLMLVAGLFIALSNLFMRKSLDAGASSKGYVMMQLFVVFLVSILINPIRTADYSWSSSMALFGLVGGIILVALMNALSNALRFGPPGLTVAMFNTSTLMPILVLMLIFGASFGYVYTLWNALGSLLVLFGLFWASTKHLNTSERKKWLSFTFIAFASHVFFLCFLEWRALFIKYPHHKGLGIAIDPYSAVSQWFMPMIFLAASAIQAVLFFREERRAPLRSEITYGTLGGITNGVGTFLMIRASEVATSFEQAMIYPMLSVTIIVACNLWGRWLYQEKVNWTANAFCVLGILVGTLNWKAFLN